ncbi:MAG TPA: 50S ribosomal protein L4 [Acidobacteriota bacterium]
MAQVPSEIEIKSLAGAAVDRMPLPKELEQARIKPDLIHEVVVSELAGLRRGTAKTKTRGEVQGSGKKPWRQKGTGRARVGEIRNPLWRKGGTVHGPVPRDYSMALPRRKRQAALRSALALKLRDQQLTVLDQLALETPKTKALATALRGLGLSGALLVDRPGNANLELASRNLVGFKHVNGLGLSLSDLMKFDHVVMTRAAFEDLTQLLSKPARQRGAASSP